MLLAINIGNTNITTGIFDGAKIVNSWKTAKENVEEFANKISKCENIDGVILSSVVPQITPSIINLINKLDLPDTLIVNKDIKLPIKLAVENPEKVGADLIANMSAANTLHSKPTIVLDCGTATTLCLLSKNSEFTGAVIAPGLRSMASALSESAALLPEVKIIKPTNTVGINTIESMQIGIYYGYVGLVRELLKKAKDEYRDATVVATGGNIKNIITEIKGIDTVEESLILRGLQIIYGLNV